MSNRGRSWCFTVNNYSEDDVAKIENLNVRYCVYGKEVAPGTGTPHLQGFLYFANARRFDSVCADLPAGTHVEIAKGSAGQNRAYCKKDGDWRERGEPPLSPGEKGELERQRWDDIIELARYQDLEQIRVKYPEVYANKLRQLEYLRAKRPRDSSTLEGDGPFHLWVVGPTGAGKSRWAREHHPGAYCKEPESRWWDGYDFEECVIIDDFDKFQVAQGGQMKRWLDRYAFQAEIKGGMALIRPKKIIVTSQYLPCEIWDDEKTVDAIMRRVEIVHMGSCVSQPFVDSFKRLKK